jgi:hypothetical protein
MNKILLAVGLAIPCLGLSQQFQKVFGGDGFDIVNQIIQLEDQSYLAFGGTTSISNSMEGIILQLDGMGNLQSATTLSLLEGFELSAVLMNDSGTIFFAGTATDAAGNPEIAAGEMTSDGQILWAKGVAADGIDALHGLCLTEDGGFACIGITNSFSTSAGSDPVILRFNSNGDISWAHAYEIEGYDRPDEIAVHPDGGFVVFGHHIDNGEGDYDTFFMHVSEFGDLNWIKRYTAPGTDLAWSVMEFQDGFLLGGDTDSFGLGLNEIFLMHVDTDGEIIWQKTYGDEQHDHLTTITPGKAGKIMLGGLTSSMGAGGLDAMATELEADGSLNWTKAYGGSDKDVGFSAIATADGGYIFGGYSRSFSQNFFSDAYIIKTNERGDCMCNTDWDAVIYEGESNYLTSSLTGSKIILIDFTNWNMTSTIVDLTVSETLCTFGELIDGPADGEESSSEITLGLEEMTSEILSLVPVPHNGSLQIEVFQNSPANLSVYTITGKMVQNVSVQGIGRQTLTVKVQNLIQGIYLVNLVDAHSTVTKKVYVH